MTRFGVTRWGQGGSGGRVEQLRQTARWEGRMWRRSGVLLTCAWVLWSQMASTQREGPEDFRPYSAYETKKACEEFAVTALKQQKSRYKGAKVDGFVMTWHAPHGEMQQILSCLPDTIDPRRPK